MSATAGAAPRAGGGVNRVGRDQVGFWDDPSLEPVLSVEPGELVTFETLDARSGALLDRPVGSLFELPRPPVGRGNRLTGPVAVRGARPGDALAVHIDIDDSRSAPGWTGGLGDGADVLRAAGAFSEDLRQRAFSHVPNDQLPTLPAFVVGELHGGSAPQAVAARAVVRGDVRTIPAMDWWTVRRDLEAAIERTRVPGVESSIRCLVRQRPSVGPLIDALTRAHESIVSTPLEVNTQHASQMFVTDAVDMAAAGVESVVYGPGLWRAVPDESIPLDEMANAARVYMGTALTLMGQSIPNGLRHRAG